MVLYTKIGCYCYTQSRFEHKSLNQCSDSHLQPTIMSWFTLVTCLFIHTQFIVGNWWVTYAGFGYWLCVWNICRGVLYLLYPVCGWIAEVYSSNFKFIKWSIIMALLTSIVSCIGIIYNNTFTALISSVLLYH